MELIKLSLLQALCNGMMQVLQGAVDVRGALHCTVGHNFLKALQARIAPTDGSQNTEDDGRDCADARPAIFVPACLIKLGVLQVK